MGLFTMQTIKLVFGSIAVYGIVAACSGADHAATLMGGDGGLRDGSRDSSSSGGDGPRILDALTDPVPEAAADPYQSGSRLKAKYYAGADGSKQFTGWWDSQMMLDCAFTPAGDGMLHCMPSTGVAQGGVYWGDATCKLLLGIVQHGCAAPGYVESSVGSPACGPAANHFFVAGNPYAGAMVWTGTTIQNCTQQALPAGVDLYTVDSELDPTQYIAATIMTEP